ncbi:MAG: outer membrane protein assembly factor BamC, partial [Wenzhouxiangella sp.]
DRVTASRWTWRPMLPKLTRFSTVEIPRRQRSRTECRADRRNPKSTPTSLDRRGMTQIISRMMKKTFLVLLMALLAGGCFNRDRQPLYAESQEVDPIRVPEGLSSPSTRPTFAVPGHSLPELAAQGDEEKPPRVQPSTQAERSRAQIRFGETGLYLEVRDDTESVWERLGSVLDGDGMLVREADDDVNRYRFDFRHDPIRVERTGLARLAFWRGEEVTDYSGTYLVEVRSGDGRFTQVALLDANGDILDMEQAEFVLAELRERLG